MSTQTIIAEADAVAAEAHHGQTRRHGAPYIDHPRAVARLVDDIAAAVGVDLDDAARAAALLHDVIEDSAAHTEDVIAARFGRATADAVVHLTKVGKGEAAVAAYYARLQKEASTSTKLIKVCDRLHNLSELHKAPSPAKLQEYSDETRRFVVPLAKDVHPGLVAAVDDALANAARNQGRAMPAPVGGIYAILQPGTGHLQRLGALLDGGVARVQLRVKHAADDVSWLDLIEQSLAVCRARGIPLIVNDRADLAFAAGADGVHLGDRDLPTKHARRLLGQKAIIGTSTHSLAQFKTQAAADIDGADHVALGPVWSSPTKLGHADPVGVAMVHEAAASSQKPVVAIGGIVSVARAVEVARSGAAFAAVLSAFAVDDPVALHALVRRFSLAFTAASVR